jgi:putative ubiquitin-RnfH superfamily antitoxin RatB of RatAB toxin-antitoxin module
MAPASFGVTVAYSPRPGEVEEIALQVQEGTTLGDALHRSGLLERHPEIDLAAQKVGIWGRVLPPQTLLRERDRVEVYRPLTVDPKEARRLRYRKDKAAARR